MKKVLQFTDVSAIIASVHCFGRSVPRKMKRIMSLALTVVILLGVVFSAGFPVSADPALTVSEECINILKAYEGFCQYPYWDYGQWTVGYGTRCPADKLDTYKENGITEEEATALLQEFIADYEKDLYYFINKYALNLAQNQFDALFLFSYNCGSGWIYSASGNFHKIIASQSTDTAAVLYQFGTWSNAGNTPLTGLIKRRLAEANMYLNNVYSKNRPANYCYVIYETNGGTIEDCVHGYDINLGAAAPITPTYAGYTFAGWFTEKTGGTQVTALDASMDGKTLYARWTNTETGESAPDPTPETPETPEATEPAEPDGITQLEQALEVKVTTDELNLRKGPGTNYTSLGCVVEGERLTVTATYKDSVGRLWGKCDSGWVCLDYTNYNKVINGEAEEESTPSVPETKVMGTVTANGCLYIRSGPGTGYERVGEYPKGTRIQILEQKAVGAGVWGKTELGWVSMTYVKLDSDTASTPAEPPATGVKGTIRVKGTLNIRSGAGTGYAIVGFYSNAASVTVLEQVTVNGYTWGKTDRGWISMTYVELGDGSTAAEEPSSGSTGMKGAVKVDSVLNIRNGAGTGSAIGGFYNNGDIVTILEQQTVNGIAWGRTDRGWISMSYVVLEGTTASGNLRTVTADCLNIRQEPSLTARVVGYLYRGAQVEILEQKTVDGMDWGRTAQGWIALAYTK